MSASVCTNFEFGREKRGRNFTYGWEGEEGDAHQSAEGRDEFSKPRLRVNVAVAHRAEGDLQSEERRLFRILAGMAC